MKNLILSLLLAFITTVSFAQKDSHQLSSHILDVSTGAPATGVTVKLEKLNDATHKWQPVSEKVTDENGRIKDFLAYEKKPNAGTYKLTFLVADYFKRKQTESFYPFIEVVFQIKDAAHYHVPITLSAYGYSTYRGN